MPHFRAYFLDATGGILFGEDIEARELSEAIGAAQELSAIHGKEGPDHIEVWSGTERLFPPTDGRRDLEEQGMDTPQKE